MFITYLVSEFHSIKVWSLWIKNKPFNFETETFRVGESTTAARAVQH